ncbi:glutaminyl-peptide cyclotransferase [Nonlabens ponticola]|uniref:Glutaminyl-peptide cyclotransferase n=1 Tax=Nonlabens ponticola TaxID=2496866 RepID=A0A3S9MY68_9FLAO|nr:glutaminyl-peptide cyclotransferase [Nonlabens ponticola]AZQ44082.1 glutaminyl-peptide cyclotransferase [Nonlabens ponticola]
MNWRNSVFLLTIALSLSACKTELEKFNKNYKVVVNNPKSSWNDGDTVNLSLLDDANMGMDSVVWRQNGRVLDGVDGVTLSRKLTNQPLGKLTYEATIYQNGRIARAKETIEKYNTKAPKIYKYQVVNEYPHSDAYTQGLEFNDATLYESAGQYNESDIRTTDVETGEILLKKELDKNVFAEGLTILDKTVYQLTWKSGYAYTYDLDLNRTGEFAYNRSKEGWGLCNDGEYLYKSDGSNKIWKIDPETFEELEYIQIVSDKKVFEKINELEWVNGKIYANIYQQNVVMIVNPENGALEAVIDMNGLQDRLDKTVVENWNDQDNVLNGIAYDSSNDRLFVTGKRWNKLFEIAIQN